MFGNRYKLAKKASGDKTAWSSEKVHRGRRVEPPEEEKTPAQIRAERQKARNEAALARAQKANQKKEKQEKKYKKRALAKAKAAAKAAGRKWTSKDAKPYK